MKEFLPLIRGLCLGRKRSASSCQQSALSYRSSALNRRLPTLCPLPPKSYKRIPLILFILVFVSCSAALAQEHGVHTAPAAKADAITGKVISAETGEPLEGATVRIKNTNITTITNAKGEFTLITINREGEIEVSFIGYLVKEISFSITTNSLVIALEEDYGILEEVTVNTGYQEIPKERATGSFVFIDNELLNRSVSSNVLDRLNGVASGVLFDKTTGTDAGFSIRGRSTIFANTDPLIVLDNFPYDGDLSTINPNDIESITILRDAAAASIWGVRASNGVVVITTKTGKLNEPVKLSLNSNVTLGQKPRLFSSPELAPYEIVDIEKYLYSKGYYKNAIASPYLFISPVVQTLADSDNNLITDIEMQQTIDELQRHDVRDDLLNYYYRSSINQQYSLGITGGGRQNRFYVSAGYDRNLDNLISNDNDRLTINAQNSYTFLNKLEASVGINFSSSSTTKESGNTFNQTNIMPYTRLADEKGDAYQVLTFKQSWLDTVGGGGLLDWSWRPLDELQRNNNKRTLTNYLLNLNLKYAATQNLILSLKYQYGNGNTDINDLSVSDSYYTRNLINQFSQINRANGDVTRPVPIGDILSRGTMRHTSQNGRVQADYVNRRGRHDFTAIAGAELKDYRYESNYNTLYGYNKELGSVATVNHADLFRTNPLGSNARIGGSPSQSGTTDRYVSFFANAQYIYSSRYGLSASARRDESNLYGVKANQKGVPLWSIGASWSIDKERFYNIPWLQGIKLRLTHGYNGNVDKTVSAYVTANSLSGSGGLQRFGLPFATLQNPPNPSLRWEKIRMTNIGFEASAFNGRISGNVDYYQKRGKDIIGNSPMPPSSGVTQFKGNSADISGKGIDVSLTTLNIVNPKFKWNTTMLFSRTSDKIVDYKVNTSPLGFRAGYSYNGLFSYRWAGLDAENGNPLGYYNGDISSDWSRINNADSIGKTTMYNGAGTPVYFGSFLNTLGFKKLKLSFNVTYKLGYYFRTPSINYGELYSLRSSHEDYRIRWQKTGDELTTSVPSSVFPANSSRDQFYTNSAVLVEKGDHIRLQDVQINYRFKGNMNSLFTESSVYLYANNLAVLWTANRKGIDPENILLKPQQMISLGFRAQF